jgi:hypothetical protein
MVIAATWRQVAYRSEPIATTLQGPVRLFGQREFSETIRDLKPSCWPGTVCRKGFCMPSLHLSTPQEGVHRLMRRLKRAHLTPDQDIIIKIVALFHPVMDRLTALQASKQVSALLQEAGHPCTGDCALEALAAYKGFRTWDALVAKLPKGTKKQNEVQMTSQEDSIMSTYTPNADNRFKIGDQAFLRDATYYWGATTIPAETQVTIVGVPGIYENGRKENRYLISLSHEDKTIEIIETAFSLLTEQELKILRIHSGGKNIVNFALIYGQEISKTLGDILSVKPGFNKDEINCQVRPYWPNDRAIYFSGLHWGPIDFNQKLVADMDGGYTIITPEHKNHCDLLHIKFPNVKIQAGISPQEAAQQVFQTMRTTLHQKTDTSAQKLLP